MSYNVTIRTFRRPDQPQQIFNGVIDAQIAKWAPIWSHENKDSYCAEMRALLDVRRYDWDNNFEGYAKVIIDPLIAKYAPIWNHEIKDSWRADLRPLLDVRRYDWDNNFESAAKVIIDPLIAKYAPIWEVNAKSYRTEMRLVLDVRDWNQALGWIFKNLPAAITAAQIWPAIQQALSSFRTADGRLLDPRSVEGYTSGWVKSIVDTIVAQWLPIFDAEFSYRTFDKANLDVRGYEWANGPAWVAKAADKIIAQWLSIFDAELSTGIRTQDGPQLDVRRYDWMPSSNWKIPTDAIIAKWISIFDAEIGIRTPDKAVLDVRGYEWNPEFTWPTKVNDAIIAKWSPAFDSKEKSYRTQDGKQLDVRVYEWLPESGWIFKNLPGPLSTAQIWPAILQATGLSYRSTNGPILEVRGYDWSPETGWLKDPVGHIYIVDVSAESRSVSVAPQARDSGIFRSNPMIVIVSSASRRIKVDPES